MDYLFYFILFLLLTVIFFNLPTKIMWNYWFHFLDCHMYIHVPYTVYYTSIKVYIESLWQLNEHAGC